MNHVVRSSVVWSFTFCLSNLSTRKQTELSGRKPASFSPLPGLSAHLQEHFWSIDKAETKLAPKLIIQVWDNDKFSFDDYLGKTHCYTNPQLHKYCFYCFFMFNTFCQDITLHSSWIAADSSFEILLIHLAVFLSVVIRPGSNCYQMKMKTWW